jgi:hypothetical protein
VRGSAGNGFSNSPDEAAIQVYIGLPGGIAPEEIALHRSAELDMPMEELKRVDVEVKFLSCEARIHGAFRTVRSR